MSNIIVFNKRNAGYELTNHEKKRKLSSTIRIVDFFIFYVQSNQGRRSVIKLGEAHNMFLLPWNFMKN